MVGMNRDVLNEDCPIFRRGQIDRMYYNIPDGKGASFSFSLPLD
jgi:hypothetical protein